MEHIVKRKEISSREAIEIIIKDMETWSMGQIQDVFNEQLCDSITLIRPDVFEHEETVIE